MNLQQSIRKRLDAHTQERQICHSLWLSSPAEGNNNVSNLLELLPPT
jgi:hypothetical protein